MKSVEETCKQVMDDLLEWPPQLLDPVVRLIVEEERQRRDILR